MRCKLCAVATNEIMSVKDSLSYSVEKDHIEGFQHLDHKRELSM